MVGSCPATDHQCHQPPGGRRQVQVVGFKHRTSPHFRPPRRPLGAPPGAAVAVPGVWGCRGHRKTKAGTWWKVIEKPNG